MAEMADVLEAAELNAELWVRGFGRSMWPVLSTGDSVKVRRCGVKALRVGHLAAVRTRRGNLRVHVVTSKRPFRSQPFLGGDDSLERVLGRVVSLRSRGLTLPVPDLLRAPIGVAQKVAAWSASQPWVEGMTRRAWQSLCSGSTGELRRALIGPLRVRRLTHADRDAVVAFVGDHLPLSQRFIDHQLLSRWEEHGAAAGVLGRGGKLFGFAYLDEYRQEGVDLDGHWIRSIYVSPVARGLGLAGALVDELCTAARLQGITRVEADVQADNRSSLAMLERQGFTDAPFSRIREAEKRLHSSGPLVVMQRTLDPDA